MFRFGVAGLGLGAHHAARILGSPYDWTVAAVCDPLAERVTRFAETHPAVQGYTDYERFLTESELDAVILATPHDLHAPMAIAALERGKHVLIEKPMACTVAECRAINRAAARAGKTLMVAQNWRYTPWVRAVKAILDSGEIGPVRAVRTEWLQNAVGDPRPGNWLLDAARAGGGPVISLMVHNLDCLRFLLGEPRRVQGLCVRGHPAFANNAESWGAAQFEFENGAIGQMFTSYAVYTPAAVPLAIYGDAGTILCGETIQVSSTQRGEGFATLDVSDHAGLPTADAATNEFLHFVDCAQRGVEPLTGGNDNVKTIRLIEAIYESAASGRTIDIGSLD
jgi:predicted dehydrogenase